MGEEWPPYLTPSSSSACNGIRRRKKRNHRTKAQRGKCSFIKTEHYNKITKGITETVLKGAKH